MEPILELDHVTKYFSGFTLNDISLTLDPGYIHGFIGPNGSGKTTTIRLIMNLIPPETGTIRLFGQTMQADEKAMKNRIGFVYDEPCLYEDVLPLEMKKIISKFYTEWDDNAFSRYADLFELPADKALRHFSQGMKMKFSAAVALSHHARLIIMDEPTSGLDPVSRHEILEILQNYIADEDASVLFSTHITSDLERIADYISLLHQGKLLFTLPKDDVLEKFRIVRGPLEILEAQKTANDGEIYGKSYSAAASQLHLLGVSKNSYGFEGLTDKPEFFREQYGDGVITERCSLDDLMLYMTKRRIQS